MGREKRNKKGINNGRKKGDILRVLTAHWECILNEAKNRAEVEAKIERKRGEQKG